MNNTKKMNLFALAAIFLLTAWSAKAQTQMPGGISTADTIIGWFTPDNYSNGVWINRSTADRTIGNLIQVNTWTDKTPPPTTTGNFHPAVMFRPTVHTASPHRMISQNNFTVTANDAFTFILVYKPQTPTWDYANILNFNAGDNAGDSRYKNNVAYATSGSNALSTYWPNDLKGDLGTVPSGATQLLIIDNSNIGVGGGVLSYLGGTYKGFGSSNPGSVSSQLVVGASRYALTGTGYRSFTGDIQELIILKRDKNAYKYLAYVNSYIDMKRIRSYLAVKYGVSMPDSNYVASDGTTIVWNNLANAGYNNNIFGIARDDGYGLYQKQAQSASLPIFSVFVGNELFALNSNNTAGQLDNGVYAMFGSNNENFNKTVALTDELTIPGSTTRKINYRKALVYRTQLKGAASLRVKLKFALDRGAMPEYAILSKHPNFLSTEPTTRVVPITGSGAVSTVELELSSSDNWYITMGGHMTELNEGPGGISAGLKLWLRADDPASVETAMMPAGVDRLRNYEDAASGVAVPAVLRWIDTVRHQAYTNTGAGPPAYTGKLDANRLWPVYQPSNYMANYYPAIRFWGDDYNSSYLGNDDSLWTEEFASVYDGFHRHSAFFVVNNDFGSNPWVYSMMFTRDGFGGYGGPGYGVQEKTSGEMVGRFRTYDYGQFYGEAIGTEDLFKPGATSILAYHHRLPVTSPRPKPSGESFLDFRFNGLEDINVNANWYYGATGKDVDNWTKMTNRSVIGTGWDYNRTIQGVMSEVIIYDGELPASSRQQIESYLAIKYGVTLTPGDLTGRFDYVFSDGGMLWNGTQASSIWNTFYNRIAAVIRDDASNLHNRQSHSTNVGSILHMGIAGTRLGDRADLGDLSGDKIAVIWGDDGVTGVTPVSLNDGCGDFEEVFNRKWLVHKRTNGQPISMIVGAQNNLGNQLGNDDGTKDLFNRLVEYYSVYMLVADAPEKLDAASLSNGEFTAVPMQYLDGEQQCIYTFADSITYITFGCKLKSTTCTGMVQFEGTKTFPWTQWTRQIYGSTINAAGGVSKGVFDLGDGVSITKTTAEYANGVLAPAYYPSVTNSPVAGSLYVQRQKGGYANSTATITIELNSPARPEFSIYDIDGYAGCFERISILGYCGGDPVRPILSYGGDPATSYYEISGYMATANVRKDLSPTDKDGQLDVAFQDGVTKIVIEYAITGNQQVSYTNNLVISPIHFRSVPPLPPVNEDGLSFVKDVAKRDVTTCEPSVEYSFYIGNVNCDPKYVTLRDTLPYGLSWLAGVGTGSIKPVDDSHIKVHYEGADNNILHIDSLYVPGAATLRVTATVAIDTSFVKVGDVKEFDNHAWIEYIQVVMGGDVDRELKSLDRETLAEETRFTATGTERPDTIRPSIETSVNKYSADSIVTATITVNNPNIDPVPLCYLDVSFDAGFTYAGGFTSTGVTSPVVPVAVSQPGDSLLTVACILNGDTLGFTIPSGVSTYTFNLKAPKLDSLVKISMTAIDSISPLRIGYIFSTETTDACLLLGMVAMSGSCELPYKDLIANNDYVSTLTGIEIMIPVLDNDSIPSACTPLPPAMREITTPPLHGAADFVNDSIRYKSDDDFAGHDTLIYRLVCDEDTSFAYVYIHVAEKPDNISDADCYVDPPATVWGIREVSVNTTNKVHNLGPLTAGDINGNDTVMIIGFMDNHGSNVNASNHPSYGFKTFYFDRELQQIVQKDSIPFLAENRRISTFSSMAIARYKGKGYIVVAGIDPCYLYAYESDGTPLWTSNNYYSKDATYFATIINITDFNHDGIPEVYTGNRIFSLETGELLCSDDNNNTGVLYHNGGDASMAADIVPGGNLELCAGTQIYQVNIPQGAIYSADGCSMSVIADMQLPTIPSNASKDGATQVVDIDGDGALEVVVVTRQSSASGHPVVVYVWKPLPGNASYCIGSYQTPVNSDYYSLPMIGDIDDDPQLEIVYIGSGSGSGPNSGRMYALDYLPNNAQGNQIALKWEYNITDGSASTGMTLFDFNNDGIAEIVYRDETTLHIINGNIPNPPEASFPHVHSYTLREYPLIVDIDNDGQAEIVVAGGLTDADQHNGYVRVFKSNGSPWAPARKVWNQYAYNATNINDSLTVPCYPLNPATLFPGDDGRFGTGDDIRPYNNFRQQQTILSTKGTPLWLTPDATPDPATSGFSVVTGNIVAVQVGIFNDGDAALGPPVYVTLYKNYLSLENIITNDSFDIQINKGETKPVTIILDMDTLSSVVKVVAQVNDKGTTYRYQPECDSANNTIAISLIRPLISNDMEKDARLLLASPADTVDNRGTYPNPVSMLYSDTIEYTIKAINANIDSGTTVIIRDTIPAYLRYVPGTATWTSPEPLYASFSPGIIPGTPERDTLMFKFDSLAAQDPVTATFKALPASGVSASQPLFVNRAWITASDTLHIPTGNSTYHQGAGVSIVTFSASAGGEIFNATPQALDFRTSPRSGILVVPDEGYRFAGWSHDAYAPLRGERIEARSGIMLYDTLIIYGDVELRASFVPEEYPVRYHLHGGENPEDNPPSYTVESGAITLEAPRKAGDVFTGWTGSNGDDPQPSVTIPGGSTGERDYFANYLYSGRERIEGQAFILGDKIWSSGDELYILTAKAGSIVRVYSPDGILHKLQTIVAAGETRIKLQRGIYIVTLNNSVGRKIVIEK